MLKGVIVYKIEQERIVSGMFINDQGNPRWQGECLSKEAPGVAGDYSCAYFNTPNQRIDGTLSVKPLHDDISFTLDWHDLKGTHHFQGVGFLRGDEMIVNYWVAAH